MKLVYTQDKQGNPRVCVEVDHETRNTIRAHLGFDPPWVILDGQPLDTRIERQ